ncbi:uncharacterized protein LOC123923040 [Trifolium pratense]|uniref:Uncharacterized protein n=1 Tax=Trifolium pratense TaxID=57577 RepID=A0ACB0JHR1_TRIPR|nr:uncharacterized protein LOC123923040 [Trifolium pratense]CAJ2644639.1 unnamed protein product [Trifolium pratense]
MPFLSVITGTPISTFVIVKISDQLYPEVEPTFAARQYQKLKKKWHVFNNNESSTTLGFNRDYINPLIQTGWAEFKTLNNLPNNVEITVGHYGPRIFNLISYKEISLPTEIPSFHSRSIKPNETIFFEILMTPENITATKLKLQYNFANFLREHMLYFLLLIGDNGFKEDCSVNDFHDSKNTSLGNSWNKFAASQYFKIGDIVRFKFDLSNLNGNCKVYKLGG